MLGGWFPIGLAMNISRVLPSTHFGIASFPLMLPLTGVLELSMKNSLTEQWPSPSRTVP